VVDPPLAPARHAAVAADAVSANHERGLARVSGPGAR
jgi:hypothetical protein